MRGMGRFLNYLGFKSIEAEELNSHTAEKTPQKLHTKGHNSFRKKELGGKKQKKGRELFGSNKSRPPISAFVVVAGDLQNN